MTSINQSTVRKIAAAGLLGLLTLTPAFTLAQQAPGVTPPTAASKKEGHPEIHRAIHALENARKHLEEAKHDFGGHKAAALKACDDAIAQLKEALEFDHD